MTPTAFSRHVPTTWISKIVPASFSTTLARTKHALQLTSDQLHESPVSSSLFLSFEAELACQAYSSFVESAVFCAIQL